METELIELFKAAKKVADAAIVDGVAESSPEEDRLGFVIDFLSKATLFGFMAGAAVIVSLQQLKGLLGIVHFTNKMQIVPVISSVFKQKDEWSWQTIVTGVGFLVFLLTTRTISMRKPKFFWVSAATPLSSIIFSTLLVFLLKSKLHKISTVRNCYLSWVEFEASPKSGAEQNLPTDMMTMLTP